MELINKKYIFVNKRNQIIINHVLKEKHKLKFKSMKDLFIEGSKFSPTVDFKSKGELKMSGKALLEDSRILFTPIFKWLDDLQSEEITFDVNLEYFNTAVSKQLYELFEKLNLNKDHSKIDINWHYEEDDDDSFESGMLYKDKFLRMNFKFYVYSKY